MADFYGVSFESITVFASGYDEGFYQGMKARQKLEESQFDSDSMKVYHMGKELLTGKKYRSTLYPALKAMGYTIEVVDMDELDPAKVPSEVRQNIPDNKVFVILKGNRTIGYISPNEYYDFEHFLNTAINGYLNEVRENYKKADKNPASYRIMYNRNGKGIRRIKLSERPDIFKKVDPHRKIKTCKIRSAQDEYSADKQLKQLKEKMQNHGIQDSTDDDDDEN